MEELKQRILKEGIAKKEGGIVRVSSFLNHQLDPQLMMHCAEEFARLLSFTRGDEATVCVDRNLLTEQDRIVFIDDFLADGHASGSIIHLCRQSGAQIVGMGFLVEKGFAKGGQFLRDHGIEYHALATVKRINDDNTMEME